MLGDLVLEITRALTAAAPPPLALPYLGMDHPTDTGFHLLDGLSARGIFRKYELVLALGDGLGASARWLAARLGCEVVATAAADEAAAGGALSRRTALAAQVRHVAADPGALPVGAARFTHVWIVEALPRCPDAAAALAEAHRALRPGGTLAVQDLVRAPGAPPVAVAGWRFADLAARIAAVAAAGFVEVDARDVSADAGERSARVTAARTLLLRRAGDDAELAALVAERTALAAGRAAGGLRVVQILARRP